MTTSRVATTTGQEYGSRALIARSDAGVEEMPPADLYDLLKWYYLNNGLYDDLTKALYDKSIWTEGMKPLRNPAFRVVEFYAAKLWPGQTPIVTDNGALPDAVAQIWKWSNWPAQKQVAARWFAMYGDLFIKVAVKTKGETVKPVSVYMQLIEPQRVTAFDTNERGFITYARIDTPILVREGDKAVMRTHTEVWDKANDSFRVWQHERTAGYSLDQLGEPDDERSMSQAFGIDFVPIAHGLFRDIGEERGMAAITHALDKIDEANRQATRLHQMVFRYGKVTEVLEGQGTDPSGRPLPPPKVSGPNGRYSDDDTIAVGDNRIVRLPSGWTWRQAVPTMDYTGMLAILQAQIKEIESDLPELAYYAVRDMGGDISGRAVRLLLGDAIDRVIATRENGETAIVQAQQMALTIGAKVGVLPDIGAFDQGALDHTFAVREVVATDETERMETVNAMTTAGIPLVTALRRVGWTEEEIAAMQEDKAANADFARQALEQARRLFEQGPELIQDMEDDGPGA